MNWKTIHDQIIKRAQSRTLEGYSELHHILPKCLGGTDDPSNLVRLTAREHFIIHKILTILYPKEDKLYYAVWSMTNRTTGDCIRDYKIGSREYERLRNNFSSRMSKSMMGENNPNYGRDFTEEERLNMSEAQKRRFQDPNERLKANPFYGITEERRAELSEIWSNASKGSKNGRFKYDKKVARINKETDEVLEVYDYVRDLDALGYASKYVINCCNGKSTTHAKFKWAWVDKDGEV
jgi:hypothetical protein